MKNNIIQEKSYAFSKEIVLLYLNIIKLEKEYVISKQLLKSGTSIGANVAEAQSAISRKDFNMKLTIALKEARETHYWLRLIKDTNIYSKIETTYLLDEVNVIVALLSKITRTLKAS